MESPLACLIAAPWSCSLQDQILPCRCNRNILVGSGTLRRRDGHHLFGNVCGTNSFAPTAAARRCPADSLRANACGHRNSYFNDTVDAATRSRSTAYGRHSVDCYSELVVG